MKKQLIFIIIAIILFSRFSIKSYAVSDVQTAALISVVLSAAGFTWFLSSPKS